MDFPHSNRYSTARQQQIRRSPRPGIPVQGNERTTPDQQQPNFVRSQRTKKAYMDFPHSNRYSTARQQQIRRSPGPGIPVQGNERTTPGRQQPDPVSAMGIIAALVIVTAMIVFWL